MNSMNSAQIREMAYSDELSRWRELYQGVTPAVRSASEGMMEKAAFIHSLCADLQRRIEETGPIKTHPEHPDIQKPVPAVDKYVRLAEGYANITNKLNNTLTRNILDDDGDDLSEFE